MGKAKKKMNPKVVQQVNREIDSLFIKELSTTLKRLPKPWEENEIGRPAHPSKVVTFCNIMREATNRTYEEIEAYVELIEEKIKKAFHVDNVPGHSVIHRGMQELTMSYIRTLIRLIIKRLRGSGMSIAVDGSGFSTSSSSKYFDLRIGKENSKKEYMKLHIAIDINTGIIHHFTITSGKAHDSPEFRRLMKYLPKIASAHGDKAYPSRKNCQIVADKGGEPYLLFKDNAGPRAKGYPAWKKSFYKYTENEEEWIEKYNQRQIVEAVFSSIKQRWGDSISSRRGWLKWRELALKVLVYNTKQMLYCRRAEELGVDLWVEVEES